MRRADWYTFQVLTKRSERLLELSPLLPWAPHVWMSVSVENLDYTFRIDHLRGTRAVVRFLSLEPLLGPLRDLNLEGIDSVIVGGESGPGARPTDPAWATEMRGKSSRCRMIHLLGGPTVLLRFPTLMSRTPISRKPRLENHGRILRT